MPELCMLTVKYGMLRSLMRHNLCLAFLSILMFAMAPVSLAISDEPSEVQKARKVIERAEKFYTLAAASTVIGIVAMIGSPVCLFWLKDPAAAIIGGLTGASWLYFGYHANSHVEQILRD